MVVKIFQLIFLPKIDTTSKYLKKFIIKNGKDSGIGS